MIFVGKDLALIGDDFRYVLFKNLLLWMYGINLPSDN